MFFRSLLICSVALLLSGCLHTLLKEDMIFINVNHDYETVYKSVSAKVQECWIDDQVLNSDGYDVIDFDLYPEAGQGVITWKYLDHTLPLFYATVKVEKSTDSSSKVTVWTKFARWSFLKESITRWAKGDLEKC